MKNAQRDALNPNLTLPTPVLDFSVPLRVFLLVFRIPSPVDLITDPVFCDVDSPIAHFSMILNHIRVFLRFLLDLIPGGGGFNPLRCVIVTHNPFFLKKKNTTFLKKNDTL